MGPCLTMNQAGDLKSLCWRHRPQPGRENLGGGSLKGQQRPSLPGLRLLCTKHGKGQPSAAARTQAQGVAASLFHKCTVNFPWLFLDQDHLNSHKIPDILCTRLPDNFTLQGWDNSNSRTEFWDLYIWHKFQEVNTLLALSKS